MKQSTILEYLWDLRCYFYIDKEVSHTKSNMPDIMLKKIEKIKQFIEKDAK